MILQTHDSIIFMAMNHNFNWLSGPSLEGFLSMDA